MSPDIQNDIVSVVAAKQLRLLLKILVMPYFLSQRMILVIFQLRNKWLLYYVIYKNGHMIECFIGLEHVANITAPSLKATIEILFLDMGLGFVWLGYLGYFISICICKWSKICLGQVHFQMHSHSIIKYTNFEEHFGLFQNGLFLYKINNIFLL